ncbi:MAG: heavy metal translocating P-type ATPase [Gemmatimonadaceae bacterium]
MTESVRLDIELLLPNIEDDQDACVARLVSMLEGRRGIERVHIAHDHAGAIVVHDVGDHPKDMPQTPGALCLHYDSDRVSLADLIGIAKRAGATISSRYAHEVIPFRAVGAEDEGARIEAAVRALSGVTAAVVNFPAQLARVEFDVTQVQLRTIVAALAAAGATPIAPLASAGAEPSVTWYARNRELAWSLTAGSLTLSAWLVGRLAPTAAPLPLALYVAAYFFGARDNVGHLIKDLRRRRFRFDIDLLMVVAAAGAAVLGAWTEGALLLFLFSLGHALEHYAMGRARNAIKALAELAPQAATVRRDGADTVVPIGQVKAGDLVVVKPGERVAVDGAVREGQSAVNQAPITGESVPVEKAMDDQVFAGSVNGEGLLVVSVSAAVGDRTLDRVIKLVAEAETQKAPTQQFADRFERIFVPLVLVADLLLIIVPPLIGVWTWSESFYRAMALLVAASPCALALGTPAAVLAGIAQAARNGVLIKGGAHLEALGGIDVFALDKTGTLTKGEPEVTDLAAEAGVDDAALLASAAAVEQHSRHPLARAISRAAASRAITVPAADEAQSVTGRGMRARVSGIGIEVGRLTMFEDASSAPPPSIRESVQRLESAGRTTMVVRAVGQAPEWLGVIGVADESRAGVRETLAELRALGVRRIVMLTGDNAGVAAAIGRAVGLDDVRAGLMPEDKVTAIRELAAQGRVAMVGDGVNDAPALAHATVGIAMGGAGTAAALETADVALMGDDLSRLPFAVGLSRRARAIIRQNLLISMSVIGVLVVATVAGWARIGPAVIVHEGSTLVVIANALRLLRYRPVAHGA